MYRARQFFGALGARMDAAVWAEVETLLTAEQMLLFRRMSRYDQRHSLNVLRSLRAAGHEQPDLLVAALLHDAAKSSGPLRLWHRVVIVLLEAFAPRSLAWLARKAAPGHWRYPFYAHRVHPEIGARWAEEAGSSSLTVWLVANHQSSLEQARVLGEQKTSLLAALRRADDDN